MIRDPNIVGPKNKYDAIIGPVVGDDQTQGYAIGSQWINTVTDEKFTCFDAGTGAAVWLESGGGGGHVDTVDPTVSDDGTLGFNAGDFWLNTATGDVFQCLSNATGAAVWRLRTPLNDFDYLVGPIGQAPFQTIQAAVDQSVTDGGFSQTNWARIGVMDGTYTETVTVVPWMILESLSSLTGQGPLFELGERVTIVGKIAFPVTSGSVNDVMLLGMHVAPTTGPALELTGDFAHRVYVYDSFIEGANDSDTITSAAHTSGNTIITGLRSKFSCQTGFYVMQPTASQRLLGTRSIVQSTAFNVNHVIVRSNGGWFVWQDGNPGQSEGAIYGAIEVQAASTGNVLRLSRIWFWRGSGLASNVVVDGTLTASSSGFLDCTQAAFPTITLTDIVISGTNSATFIESPGGNVGDIRQYDGAQWSSVAPVGIAAVTTPDDYDMTALATSFDEDPIVTGGISHTPKYDGLVQVQINGHPVAVGDGSKVADCYFSVDSGVNPRLLANITVGDTCHWMGSEAGYELTTADKVSFIYGA